MRGLQKSLAQDENLLIRGIVHLAAHGTEGEFHGLEFVVGELEVADRFLHFAGAVAHGLGVDQRTCAQSVDECENCHDVGACGEDAIITGRACVVSAIGHS